MNIRLILCLVVALVYATSKALSQNLPPYVPTNSLIGWWPLNGNAVDLSSNANIGTPNSMSWGTDRFGNANSAAEFNGIANRSIIVQNPISAVSNKKTFSVWIKMPVTYPSGLFYNNIITASNGNTGAGSSWLYFQILGNLPAYITNGWNNKLAAQASPPVSNQTLNTNTWRHLVVVFNGDSSKFFQYVDGIFTGSGPFSTPPNFNNWGRIIFGQNTNNIAECIFAGQIDDIGIWDRVLSQQEITNLYNANICFQTITVTDTLLINTGILSYNPIVYNNTIKVYPNPAKDHITIDYGNFANLSGHQIRIINSLGQQVFQTSINQQSNFISLSGWSGNGLYFIQLIDASNNIIEIKKIILQ
jgi:hypothetical protein